MLIRSVERFIDRCFVLFAPPETILQNDNEASVVAEIHACGHRMKRPLTIIGMNSTRRRHIVRKQHTLSIWGYRMTLIV